MPKAFELERDYALILVEGDTIITISEKRMSRDEAELQNAFFQRAGWDQRWIERTKE
jgi:hypothetical protein